ncbi:MAG: aminodeoxychorismate synthase component I [Terracidiphilus sp.]|jgi:para-aminobenzoate synthetase/4-amino-4-deoxychorismate lyase
MNRWHSPPAELYAVVEHTPGTILLESARPADAATSSGQPPPPTRLFTEPLRICVANHPAELPGLLAEIERAVSTGLYAAGYFSYECGAFFEPTAAPARAYAESPSQPLAWFGIYQRPHLFNHITGAFVEGDPHALTQYHAKTGAGPEPDLDCTLALTEQQYAQRIAEIHAWIRSGDVYQLNFTVPIKVHAPCSAAALYRQLRSLQPAPYGAFLHTQPDHRILSFSPELFLRLESGTEAAQPTRRITTRPMKGTAPRGRTTAEDRSLADWLRNDPKNRAENVMIVDLLRNDLGRLCLFGSVQVRDLFAVERYPTLWQMTSTISGELRSEVGFQDIFRALFPCGSITGAPKIRAMQLLSQLEQRPRGVYTGAIGFFSKDDSIFNVAIRTLSLHGDQGVMGVGSGIVIDSNPADEWRECLLKAEFLISPTTQAANPSPASFSLVETLLWQGEYPLLELHLDRLEDSADYFAFPFNRAQTESALQAHANSLTRHPRAAGANSLHLPLKVRLLLSHDGGFQITSELIQASPSEPLRIRIAAHRTHSQDPMYFHKTTHRPLYTEALQSATAAGYDDVLFLNQRGEVTEGAIHNVFIEKAGRLFTPPVDCGLLPGVQRRHILATHPSAAEHVLSLDDLHHADAIYLSNAVRGLRRAVIHRDRDC